MNGMWKCPVCAFSLYIPVRADGLRVSHVGLYADGRFPGRCILVYENHEEHLEALPRDQLMSFWEDATEVGRAVKAATGAPRVNYAVLGNAAPHLHIHIIPRQPGLEELPTRSPWNDPRNAFELSTDRIAALREGLQRLLHHGGES